MDSLRVVLADDHLLIREGVAALLSSIDGVEVVSECADYDSLLETVEREQPDAVVTDIRMPPTNTDEGIRAARHIRQSMPSVGVVVLSQFAEPSFVLRLFEEGSDRLGYLLKDRVTRGELQRALSAVTQGGSAVDSKIVEVLVSARSGSGSPIDALTPRECEVLEHIAEGLNNAAVAESMVISERAVAKHINAIFSKLGLGPDDAAVHRRVRAVLIWLSQ
ncbi:MAG: response regulator [Ilumatobacter sp.]